eukprot:Hpha_TRINITY_DN11533_c0_g2::TRINITY_DN11533_c0_g2_i1::g.32158::m.32158
MVVFRLIGEVQTDEGKHEVVSKDRKVVSVPNRADPLLSMKEKIKKKMMSPPIEGVSPGDNYSIEIFVCMATEDVAKAWKLSSAALPLKSLAPADSTESLGLGQGAFIFFKMQKESRSGPGVPVHRQASNAPGAQRPRTSSSSISGSPAAPPPPPAQPRRIKTKPATPATPSDMGSPGIPPPPQPVGATAAAKGPAPPPP